MSAYDRPLGEVRLLTVAEVAAMLRLSKMTVYRMVNSGTLPALKVGRSVRIPEHVVDEYLRRSFVDSA
jgi:excisionase family DNA binding protein